jgi:N-acetylglutamate synthase-like GNAT family acetyltransferase
MTNIRLANTDDVPGIAALMKNVFDEDINQDYCRELLAGGDYIVRVAAANDDILGLVAGFLTGATGLVRRWEVELLAVHSDHQGKGLGTQLVEAAWTDAESNQVKFARGLTQISNEAAKKCFERAGFTSSGDTLNMVQWKPANFQESSAAYGMVTLLPVETLTYRGVWVEGLDIPLGNDSDRASAVRAARAMALRENRHFASAVIPASKLLSTEVMGDGTIIGQYQWWRKP